MKQAKLRKWILSFFALTLIVLLLLSAAAYAIDPFFQFRVRDHSYILNGWLVGSGLIENYDYDTLILGSSMTQNFDMDDFRDRLGVKPLHVGLGGIELAEIDRLINLAYEAPHADQFFVCVDLSHFTNDAGESRYPEHLLKKDLLSRLRYLLSYEVWFRYIPVDVGLMALDRLGVQLPAKFEYSRSIDRLEDWRLDFPETGKQVVLDNYIHGRYSVSEVDTASLYERMTAHIDAYLQVFRFEKGRHVFFFPPYSSLYWCDAQESGYYDAFLRAKRYFVEQAAQYGAEIYDFQSADLTLNLDNYKDTTHFLPVVNSWMVACFASGEYLVSEDNYLMYQEKLNENTNSFRDMYAYLFSASSDFSRCVTADSGGQPALLPGSAR